MNRIALLVASLCMLTACGDEETENTKKAPKAQSGPTAFLSVMSQVTACLIFQK